MSAALLVCGLLTWFPLETGLAQPASDPRITRILCMGCHADKFESTALTPHRVLDDADWQRLTNVALSCIGCHGDPTQHLAVGGGRGTMFGFRAESPLEQTAACRGCHSADHPRFDSSPHARAGVTCTGCHNQHAPVARGTALLELSEPGLEPLDATSALCAGCHEDVVNAFDFNERHRLREGVLTCTSCHDPHAPASRSLLGGFKQEQCGDCHADKDGPFVFEHPASRVDGCTACHTPHASPNRHLLAHERVAELCISCHAAVPQFHFGFGAGPTRFGLDTQCTNCHSSIHGSNLHPFFLR